MQRWSRFGGGVPGSWSVPGCPSGASGVHSCVLVEQAHALAVCSGNLAGVLPVLRLTGQQAGVPAGVMVAGLENHRSASIA